MSIERKILGWVAVSPWKKKSIFGRYHEHSKPLTTFWEKGGQGREQLGISLRPTYSEDWPFSAEFCCHMPKGFVLFFVF